MTVTDGRGRRVRDEGLARWLAAVSPARVSGEVAIALVSDQHIRRLNHQYRKKDAATDVLSFTGDTILEPRAANRDPRAASREPRNRERAAPRFLGDIVIATGVARRQAQEVGHAYATELRVLALHGLLHLLGYDHEHSEDQGRMARVEARLRRKGGLHAGLIRRVRPAHHRPQPTTLRPAQGRPDRRRRTSA